MFPIANDSGRVIAFTGRTLSTDEKAGPKYLNSPETAIYSKSRVLFNLDHAKEAIRKLDYAILVEGQMDCISVFAAGFQNVIASSGTAFTELQAKLLGRFSKNAVVNFDPDTAGAKATERTLGLLVEEEFQIKVLTLEHGFDPDLFIRRKGKDAYVEALAPLAALLRLPDRARAHAVSGAHARRQGEGNQSPAAAYSARAQPHCPRRVGARDRAEAGHRLGRAAPGTEACCRQPIGGYCEGASRSADHGCGAHPGAGASVRARDAERAASISRRAMAPKRNSIRRGRHASPSRASACTWD